MIGIKLTKGKEVHEFECMTCGSLIIVSQEELDESEDVSCAHCGMDYLYDPDNWCIVLAN